jgi:hypothetical protein
MSNKRQRMTWAALDREAAAAPATPGYGVEDQDHPAHTQDDPGSAPYMIGGPSEFAEDVHPGPYTDSGPPAIPGYGVEDQDHPAHSGQIGRKASVMELVRQKSAKALRLARATLGKQAEWSAVEDQAFGFMSMDDTALDASIERLGGGDFLAGGEGLFHDVDPDKDIMGMDDEFGDPALDDGLDMPLDDGMGMGMEARLKAMETELVAMRAAAGQTQNDPAGQTLGASGETAEQEKADEKAISLQNDKAAHDEPFLAMFDAYDTDGDGFVTAEDWTGPRQLFASLDTDSDGIIARHEVMAGAVPEQFKDHQFKKKDDKGGDDDDDKGSDKEASFGQYAEFDEDELEMMGAMDFGEEDDIVPEDDAVMGCGGVMASKKSDDDGDADDEGGDSDPDEGDDGGDDDDDDDDDKDASKKKAGDDEDEDDEGSDKEASGDAEFFQTGFDPMGLSDGTQLTAQDEAAFKTVFGSDDEDEEEDKGSDKEASLDSMLNPQPRTASTGVQRVGQVSRTAAKKEDDLSSLWASDPDVSGSFS